MVKRKKKTEWIFPIINYGFLLILGFLFVYPVIHVIAASFSDPIKLMQHQGGLLWPLGFSLKGYEVVLSNPNMISGYINTLINVILGTSISILATIIGAYVLSRKDFMFRKKKFIKGQLNQCGYRLLEFDKVIHDKLLTDAKHYFKVKESITVDENGFLQLDEDAIPFDFD